MKAVTVVACAFVLAVSLAPAAAQKRPVDLGKAEFNANCAACHGLSGKGDGPVVPALKLLPTDLTKLAKNNNGVLPVARLIKSIQGDTKIAAHGTSDMPAWGRRYRIEAGEYYVDMPYDPKVYVRARILTLIDYINRLQEK